MSVKHRYHIPWKEIVLDYFEHNESGLIKDLEDYIIDNYFDLCILKAYSTCKASGNFDYFETCIEGQARSEKLREALNKLADKGTIEKRKVSEGAYKVRFFRKDKGGN